MLKKIFLNCCNFIFNPHIVLKIDNYFFTNKDAAKINAKIIPTNNKISATLLSPLSLNTKLNMIMIIDSTTSPTVFAIDSADIIDHHA